MPASAKGCHVRFEPAKESDDEELRALLHKTPMGGSISVAFLREPEYFSATRIQGPFTQVFIAKVGEEIVGTATRAIRPMGKPMGNPNHGESYPFYQTNELVHFYVLLF